MEQDYKVVAYGPRGEKITLDLMKSMTVRQLREKILQSFPGHAVYDRDGLRLIFNDKRLDDDDKLLTEYGIQHMSVIHMVIVLLCPEEEDGGKGDKMGENLSMERPEKAYKVMVIGLRGEEKTLDLMKSMTVRQLREKIAERNPRYADAGEDCLRLIFKHKCLDDNDKLLSDYGIQHMSVIHMVIVLSGGGGGPREEDGGMGDKTGKN